MENREMRKEKEKARKHQAREKISIVNNFAPGANCQLFNGNMSGCIIAMPGVHFTQQVTNPPTPDKDEEKKLPAADLAERQPDLATLRACATQVREYFWSESAMTVIFCVCRDCFGYPDNMSQFEREFECREGLLSNTFRNNRYMRLHINKWKENGAKSRVLTLVDVYRATVEKRLDCSRKATSEK